MPSRPFPSHDSSLNQIRRIFSGRVNILCIEDNVEICSLLCEDFFRSPVLNKKAVHTFDTAKGAILGKTTYHCWILDLSLERHNDGIDLLKLRQGFPFCIVISGAQSLGAATEAFKSGVYSAYDKNQIFWANPHKFIRETCALSAISFLLDSTILDKFDMFKLLIENYIQTPEEWGLNYCRNERTIRDACMENSGLTARQFLHFFHALYAVLFSDCVIKGKIGYDEVLEDLIKKEAFYDQCSEYVLSHLENVYGPRYLKTDPQSTSVQ